MLLNVGHAILIKKKDDTFNFDDDYGRVDTSDEDENQLLGSDVECRGSPEAKLKYKRQILREENAEKEKRVAELVKLSENDQVVSQAGKIILQL